MDLGGGLQEASRHRTITDMQWQSRWAGQHVVHHTMKSMQVDTQDKEGRLVCQAQETGMRGKVFRKLITPGGILNLSKLAKRLSRDEWRYKNVHRLAGDKTHMLQIWQRHTSCRETDCAERWAMAA